MPVNLSLTAKLGHLFKSIIGNIPAVVSAGTRNGSAINRRVNGALAMGATLSATSGAVTGTPDSLTHNCKLQDSADGSTGWADYIPPDQTTVAKVDENTAASTLKEVDVNLAGAKQYIRTVEVTAFVGGTTPTIAVQSTVALYGFDRDPQ